MKINPETAERIVLSDAAFAKVEEITSDTSDASPSPALVKLFKERKLRQSARANNADDGPSM